MIRANELPPSPFVTSLEPYLAHGQLDVLDVGCCAGRNANYLASLGHNVIGLSLDLEEVKGARDMAIEKGLSTRFVVGDARRLPFRKKFDLVVCTEVLHQLPQIDRELVIGGIQAATNPGGINIISDYCGDAVNALDETWLNDIYLGKGWNFHKNTFDRPSYQSFGAQTLVNSKAYLVAVKQ